MFELVTFDNEYYVAEVDDKVRLISSTTMERGLVVCQIHVRKYILEKLKEFQFLCLDIFLGTGIVWERVRKARITVTIITTVTYVVHFAELAQ